MDLIVVHSLQEFKRNHSFTRIITAELSTEVRVFTYVKFTKLLVYCVLARRTFIFMALKAEEQSRQNLIYGIMRRKLAFRHGSL